MRAKILIVGAGPAGSSLAIRLALAGFRVTLAEKESFPRHKLCGEFISPECIPHFESLGVLDQIEQTGAQKILRTDFFSPGGRFVSVSSDIFRGQGFALGLSRAEMDFRLLERARSLGVEVFERAAAARVNIENGRLHSAVFRDNENKEFEIEADLFVDATGRASILSKLFARETPAEELPQPEGRRLVGFKAHLRNADLASDRCEMYFFRGGYAGLGSIEGGLANLCFLVTSNAAKSWGGKADLIVDNLVMTNKRATRTLRDAEPVQKWLAVSVDSFGIKTPAPAENLLAIGDSAAFVDPFSGSGMLMAMESGEVLADCISEFGANRAAISRQYTARYIANFKNRLRICSLLRRAAFVPSLAGMTISALSPQKRIVDFLARRTRSSG